MMAGEESRVAKHLQAECANQRFTVFLGVAFLDVAIAKESCQSEKVSMKLCAFEEGTCFKNVNHCIPSRQSQSITVKENTINYLETKKEQERRKECM